MWGRVITPLSRLKAPSPATKKWIFEFYTKFGFRNHLQTFWPRWLVKSELSLGLDLYLVPYFLSLVYDVIVIIVGLGLIFIYLVKRNEDQQGAVGGKEDNVMFNVKQLQTKSVFASNNNQRNAQGNNINTPKMIPQHIDIIQDLPIQQK